MPPNTVYVGRPSKWGNPFKIGYTSPSDNTSLMTRETVLTEYEHYLNEELKKNPHFLDELKGKDLACWCPLDKSCHVDVILKLLKAAVVKNE